MLLEPPRYFPLEKPLYEVAPALKTWGTDLGNGELDSKIFQFDREFPRYRANKLDARRERLGKYVCEASPSSLSSKATTDFLRARLVAEWPAHFRAEGSLLHCLLTEETLAFTPDGELDPARSRVRLGDSPPYASAFDALVCQFPEDLGLVELGAQPGEDRLTALHLCAPSHWAAEDKIGHPFVRIHDPIPGVEKLNRAAPAIVDAMVNKGPYVRFVWGFATDTRLNHHPVPPPGESQAAWKGRSFALSREGSPFTLRVERQVIWGLPRARASLFLIRVSFIDGARLSREERALLSGAIRSMNPASLAYKGLLDDRDAVLDWLDRP